MQKKKQKKRKQISLIFYIRADNVKWELEKPDCNDGGVVSLESHVMEWQA